MGKIITLFEVADINKALVEEGCPIRLHLHDACGGQYLSWEGDDTKQVRDCIERRFSVEGFAVTFDTHAAGFRLG